MAVPEASARSSPTTDNWQLTTAQWGMVSFLVSEVALFGTLIVTYVFYLGKDVVGPTPAEALSLPLVLCTTACLLASSGTVHVAEKALHRGNQDGFVRWWLATIVLGMLFLSGTAYEWHELIVHHGLTISRNLFGTTYYTLVGLHALHVTGGVTIMFIVLGLALRHARGARDEGRGTRDEALASFAPDPSPLAPSLSPLAPRPSPLSPGVGLVSWYWHFVDGVWAVVFTVVYLVGR